MEFIKTASVTLNTSGYYSQGEQMKSIPNLMKEKQRQEALFRKIINMSHMLFKVVFHLTLLFVTNQQWRFL